MTHKSSFIILSEITLPPECETPLDNMVANGAYGTTREEVCAHYICRRLGVEPVRDRQHELPEQAADAAQEATGCGDTPDGTTPPDEAPPDGPLADED